MRFVCHKGKLTGITGSVSCTHTDAVDYTKPRYKYVIAHYRYVIPISRGYNH